MNLYYLLQAPGWIIVFLTACARIDDIGLHQRSMFWIARRIALIMAAAIAAGMLATPFTESKYVLPDNSWRGLVIAWAWAGTWLTTPNHPPWHKWLAGTMQERRAYARDIIGRVTKDFPALGDKK